MTELRSSSRLTSRPYDQATLALYICALGVVLSDAVNVHMQAGDSCKHRPADQISWLCHSVVSGL